MEFRFVSGAMVESGGQEEFHMRGGKRKMEASNGNKLDKAIAIVVKQDRLWRSLFI